MLFDFAELLGLSLDKIVVSPLVATPGEVPSILDGTPWRSIELPRRGLSFFATAEGRVVSIVFFAAGDARLAVEPFRGDLPEGLRREESREEVHERLGAPNAKGGGESISGLGIQPAWDRYDRERYSIRIHYAPDERSISIVALVERDASAAG